MKKLWLAVWVHLLSACGTEESVSQRPMQDRFEKNLSDLSSPDSIPKSSIPSEHLAEIEFCGKVTDDRSGRLLLVTQDQRYSLVFIDASDRERFISVSDQSVCFDGALSEQSSGNQMLYVFEVRIYNNLDALSGSYP